VPREIDAALQQLLERFIKDFLYFWYEFMTDNMTFVDALKVELRFLLAVIVRRAKSLAWMEIVHHTVLPKLQVPPHPACPTSRFPPGASVASLDEGLRAADGACTGRSTSPHAWPRWRCSARPTALTDRRAMCLHSACWMTPLCSSSLRPPF
jgi:hypothetical protein